MQTPMEEYRCPDCRRRLLYAKADKLQIRCPRCKRMWFFEGGPSEYVGLLQTEPERAPKSADKGTNNESDTFPS